MDWEEQARQVCKVQFGREVSFHAKGKSLNKFGRIDTLAADVWSTVALFQDGIPNETFATANTVDSAVSDDPADVGLLYIEGHYLADNGSDLIFHKQTVQLNGTTPVALPRTLCRASRLRNATTGTITDPADPLEGNVYVYDSALAGGVSGGTPNIAAATKIMLDAGDQGSQKVATSLDYQTFWAVTVVEASVERQAQSPDVELRLESRSLGGVWTPLISNITLRRNYIHTTSNPIQPWILIPPNSDVRMSALSDTNNTTVHATIYGILGLALDKSSPA